MKSFLYHVILLCSLSSYAIVAKSQTQQLPCAKIEVVEKTPTLYIGGKKEPPFAYMSYLGEPQFYSEVAAAGIHLYNIPAYLGDRGINSTSGIGPFRPEIWSGPNQYDFSSVSKDFAEIIAADPKGKAIVRLHLDPPTWWEKLHPEAVCRLPDGSGYRTSFASDIWKQEAGQALEAMIDWIIHSPYVTNFVGVHVAGGYTEEWFYHYRDFFYDESTARQEAFRRWLRNKYAADNSKLQASWHNPSVQFKNALPADISGKERESGWRTTATDGHYFDTFDFQAETMANNIIYFCNIVKNASNGCLLTGAFYGYHFFVSDPRRGHGALDKLLDCQELDYLSSPNDYNRKPGEDWPPMAAIKTIQMHGKLWLAENDTRTAITTLLKDRAPEVNPPGNAYDKGVWLGPPDMETSIAFLWKNLARMLAYGYGGWWFDMWGGWFSDPSLMHVIKMGQKLYMQYPQGQSSGMEPQVAIIVDERLQFFDRDYGAQTARIIGNKYALGRTGAPYDLFLRGDLDSLRIAPYKVIWLMGLLELSSVEKTFLEKQRKKGILILHSDDRGTSVFANKKERDYPGKWEWDAQSLGTLWDQAGVHRYTKTEDVIYAGHGWIGIHAGIAGRKEIQLPFQAKVFDVINQKEVSKSTRIIDLKMREKETQLFRVDRR